MASYLPKKINEQGKKNIDAKLMKLFTLDFQPFSIVEDKGFKEFVNALNPLYDLPSCHGISKTAIPAMYEECLKKTNNLVTLGKSFCITTDCWTYVTNTSYMGVTAHFVSENFELNSLLLECSALSDQHTSQNLADEISRILFEWDIRNKIILYVSDNASNIQNALKNILGLKSFGCFAHTLNLVVTDSLKVDDVQVLINKIKIIVGHFRRSPVSNDKFIASQKQLENTPLKLIQDVATRWNSTYYMVERFTKLETPLRSTIALLDKDLPILSADEWKMANELCKILKPFESVTKTISGEKYCTSSLVITLVNGLNTVVNQMGGKNYTLPIMDVVSKLKNGLKVRCGSYENSQTLLISTFLDPRFKQLTFLNLTFAENAKKLVTNVLSQTHKDFHGKILQVEVAHQPVTEMVEDDEYEVWRTYNKIVSEIKPRGTPLSRALIEVQRYLENDDVHDRNSNPLTWWRVQSALFPNLAELAKERLCGLATSVPCERLFSKAGLLITGRRNRLSEEKAKMLLFLNSNLKLTSKE